MYALLVIGTRPQIIKSAPLLREAERRGLELDVVHTGQHYDYEMSRVFFYELTVPDPVVNLGVGSGSHTEQTGRVLRGLVKDDVCNLERDFESFRALGGLTL